MEVTTVFSLLGGLGLFLFGIKTMGDGLEQAAGSKMKRLLEALTRNKLTAVLVGLLVTAVIQSSSATTVMVVGFVNAGLLSLSKAIGVIMGANIGTTVTSLMLSVKLNFGVLFTAVGAICQLAGNRSSFKLFGQIMMGLGILFVGMDAMTAHMEQTVAAHKQDWEREERKAYKKRCKSRRKALMIAILLLNFGILAVLKYYNFFAESMETLFASVGLTVSLGHIGLLLPLGISFYTFQSMGYVLDVYREKVPAERNVGKLALFVSFFPQIIQGPIGVYDQLAHQLYAEHRYSFDNIRFGAQLILWGFFKKLVIADRAVDMIHTVAGAYTDYAGTYVLLAALVYALQLYADFSGGIDISRGVAQMFGITMGENFRRPYFSRTLTEYWHRWHISLGDWLRNYLFYPLSISKAFLNWGRHARQHLGSHIGKVLPTAVASLITFLIIGIWHGASWKYVAFGFWNGMVILVSTLLQPVSDKVVAALHIERKSAWYQVFSMLRTFVVVLIGYYFDIADGFRAAMGMMLKSVTDLHLSQLRPGAVLEALYDWAVLLFGTVVIFTASVIQERSQRTIREILDEKCLALRWAVLLAGIFAVVLMGVYGPGVQASEFVYMQF